MCVELGLHRRRKVSKLTLKSELNKRLFWSCYWWDREIAIAMGRPPSISDHDIDIDVSSGLDLKTSISRLTRCKLPLDVDEANRNVDVLEQLQKQIVLFPHLHKPR